MFELRGFANLSTRPRVAPIGQEMSCCYLADVLRSVRLPFWGQLNMLNTPKSAYVNCQQTLMVAALGVP